MSSRESVPVKTKCYTCDDVQVKSIDVSVYIYREDKARNYYVFTCPKCKTLTRKPANNEIVRALVRADAELVIVPIEAEEEHTGNAISWDDVLDFALAIESADPFAELTERA